MMRTPWSYVVMLAVAVGIAAAQTSSVQQERIAALQQAAERIGAQDYSGAETSLRALLLNTPEDPLALNLLGVVRMGQQRPTEAEELFRHAIEKGPRIAGPHVNLAMLYGDKRPEEAIAELGKALGLAPDSAPAQAMLRTIAPAAASAAARSGDKDRAMALMLRAQRILPHDPDLLVETALAALETGLNADAEKYLLEALAIRPDFPRANYALARACVALGKMPEAEEQMRKYLAAKPDDATAQYGLGYILIAEQKRPEAKAAFERSLELEPKQTESLFQLGELAAQEGKRDEAAERFAKVLAIDPRHAGALTSLGALAFRAGKLDDALGQLERAVSFAPSYQKAHYYYALTLKKLGRQEEAEREFRISTDLQKHDAPIARIAPDRK